MSEGRFPRDAPLPRVLAALTRLGFTIPAAVRVDLRQERVTIRLSAQEMRAVDQEARTLGVGRSTLIRMLVRQGLGLPRREEATAGPVR